MNHCGTKTLETQRLILRRKTVEDAESAFRNYTGDAKVTTHLSWKTHESVKETAEYIASIPYNQPDTYDWGIVLKKTGEVIGTISIVRMREEQQDVEVGYCLGSGYWGRGIMPEAFHAVIAFLSENVQPRRIFAGHSVYNAKSGRVMQKCGLTYYKTVSGGHDNSGDTDIAIYEFFPEKKQTNNVRFYPLSSHREIAYAVVAARENGKWLFDRHKDRTTWEMPGGHIETGESAMDAGRREMIEETGAEAFSLCPVCIYGVVHEDGSENYGLLYFADVAKRQNELHLEIEEVMSLDSSRVEWTYPGIQPFLLEKVQAWLACK